MMGCERIFVKGGCFMQPFFMDTHFLNGLINNGIYLLINDK